MSTPDYKRVRRESHHERMNELIESLSKGVLGKGVHGFCGGCTNAQIKAAAKKMSNAEGN